MAVSACTDRPQRQSAPPTDSGWIADFEEFCRRQWADFDYKLSDGETLNEVQRRNIRALNAVLARYDGKNIVIGSHGTALSVVINHFDRSFGYAQFQQIRNLMPWVVRFAFEEVVLVAALVVEPGGGHAGGQPLRLVGAVIPLEVPCPHQKFPGPVFAHVVEQALAV